MDILTIFLLQFVMSTLVLSLIATWFWRPKLAKLDLRDALIILTLPHAFRHLGMVFLVPGIVSPDLRPDFAAMAAYGDLLSAVLAIISLAALRYHWSLAYPLVWVLSIVGFADLVNALSHAEVVSDLNGAWYIPTFVVPLLLVTHVMAVKRLIWRKA